MWPGCQQCGAAVPLIDDTYCGGDRCVNKGGGRAFNISDHKPYTKKKLTRKMIKARRKRGRK